MLKTPFPCWLLEAKVSFAKLNLNSGKENLFYDLTDPRDPKAPYG